jgi:hypothetical protein
MARSVMDGGLLQAAAARLFNTTPKTVAKWVARFRANGVAGLQDRSSRPHSSPSQTPPAACARVEALGFRHRRACPVRGLGQRRLHGQRHDALGDSSVEFEDARRPRLIMWQPFKALGGEAFLRAPNAGLGLARLAYDCVRAEPFGAQQHDPGAPDMLLCGVPVADQDAKPIKIGGSDGKVDARSHPLDWHVRSPEGIPIRIQMSGSIH